MAVKLSRDYLPGTSAVAWRYQITVSGKVKVTGWRIGTRAAAYAAACAAEKRCRWLAECMDCEWAQFTINPDKARERAA